MLERIDLEALGYELDVRFWLDRWGNCFRDQERRQPVVAVVKTTTGTIEEPSGGS